MTTRRMMGMVLCMALGSVGTRVLAGDDKPDWKGTIAVAKGTDEAALPGMAKFGFSEAIQAALKKVPGKVLKAEIEEEDGFLIYSIEIVGADKAVSEVNLDAGTGAVLAVEKEDPAKEAAEKKDCKKKSDKDKDEEKDKD